MDILNIIFGVVTITSFVFALYERSEVKKHELTEKSKVVLQAEKMASIYQELKGLGSNIDMIVQTSKDSEVTIRELRANARAARTQVVSLMEIAKGEKERLDGWRYGEMIRSEPIKEEVE